MAPEGSAIADRGCRAAGGKRKRRRLTGVGRGRGIVFPGALGRVVAQRSAKAATGQGPKGREGGRVVAQRSAKAATGQGPKGREGGLGGAERSARAETGRRRKRRGWRQETGRGRNRGLGVGGGGWGRKWRRGRGEVIETVWGWVAPFQNAFIGEIGNGFRGGAEDGRRVGPAHGESNGKRD
jgi:hypothetical protein